MMVRAVTISPSAALAALTLALFLLNSGVAMRHTLGHGDTGTAGFIAAATSLLCALLAAVHAHERTAARRGLLRAAAWVLSASLTTMFAHRAAELETAPAVAILVQIMADTTLAGGFCCLFVHGEDVRRHGGADGDAGGHQDP
ncbi:unnamed protein product [Urochloa humidicola]